MLKHLKTRNSGLIYHILVGKLITEVRQSNNNNSPTALKLIKKYFRGGNELYKDLQIYNHLMDSLPKKRINVTSLLKEIIDNDSVNIDKLKTEVYNLCGDIQKNYKGLNEFFNVEVSNYKLFASIYQLLEYYRDGYSDPKSIEQRMLCEQFIVSNIQKRVSVSSNNDNAVVPSLGRFGQTILLEKFIQKYKNQLSKNQFAIVYNYMKGESKILKESVTTISKGLKELKSKLPNDTQLKVNRCVKKLNEIKQVDDMNKVKTIIYCRGLLDELNLVE